MSAGLLVVNGDLNQQNSTSNDSFHPSGTQITELTGSTPAVFFASPGIVPGSSHFQDLIWTPPGAGVLTLGSDAFAHGTFSVPSSATVTGGRVLSAGDVLSLGTLTFDNVRLIVDQAAGGPLTLGNLTFQNQSPTAVQLQINHPGTGSPFTLNNLTFSTTPTTGFYLGATDLNPSDGQPLTLDFQNPVPANPGAFVQTTGGAVVNWPLPAPGQTRIWTGSADTDWSNGGNWSPAGAPSATDTVIVGAAGNLPLLSTSVTVATLTVTGTGGNVTLNGHTLDIAGDLVVTSNAVLTMTNAADQVTVGGNATFQGGDETGLLSAGTLTVKGNFAQHNGNANAFAASGTAVVLDGGSQQTVIFDFPGAGNSRFQNLTVTNAAGIKLNTNVVIGGTFIVNGTTPVTDNGGQTLTVLGLLTASNNSSLTLAGFSTPTAPVIGGTYNVTTTTYTGNLTIPSLAYGNLVVSGVGTVSANFGALGNITVSGSGGDLVVNGHTVSTVGNFTVTNGALLTMTNPADQLQVFGAATFQGGDETGHLTAGTIILNGDFAQHNGSANAFAASGTLVVMNGTSQQGVVFDFPGSGNSRFQNLTVNNPAGIQFNTNAVVNGNLTANGPTPITHGGAFTLTVAGALSTVAGSSVTLNGFTTATAPVIIGTYSVGTTTYTGTGMSFPVLSYTNMVLTGDGSPAGNLTLTGSLTVSNTGANFTVGGRTLALGGDLVVTSNGVVTMTNAADQVTVTGNATFQGGDETGLLSAGTLTVKGNFAQHNGNANAFAASGTLVVLNGTTQQSVTFDFPGAGTSRFQNLTVNNPAGIKLTTTGFVNGSVAINGATPLTDNGGQTLTVAGQLTSAAASSVTLNGLTTATAPVIGGSYNVGTTTYTGTGMSFPVLPYTNMVLTGDGSPAGNLTLTGSLTVTNTGANFTVGGRTLALGGDLVVTSNGLVTMTNAADQVTVTGNATFQGGDETNSLTAGTLTVKGNFAQHNGNANAFAASGTAVVLNGTSQQAVQFDFPGSGNSRFQNLTINNPAGVKLTSNGFVNGSMTVTGATPLSDNGGQTLTVAGPLSTAAGSSVTLTNFTTASAPVIGGSYSVGTTTYTGTGMGFPVLPYTNVVVIGDGSPAGNLTLTGTLTVTNTGANFSVGGRTLTLGGDLMVTANALFTMTSGADQVTVTGNATFQGGDETGLLSAGTLTIKGNFAQHNGNANAFAASGTHKVVLNGVSPQTVTFDFPGVGTSHFQSLDVTSNTGGITITTAVFVNLQLISGVGPGAPPKLSGGGNVLTTVSGAVARLVLDHTQLVVNEQGSGHAQQFDNMTFQNFPTTATGEILFNVTAVGGAAAARTITVNTTTVQTSLGTGGLYVKAVSSNGFGLNVVMSGSNDATGGPSRSNPPFGQTVAGATIIWQ
jgi:hypothetical protein